MILDDTFFKNVTKKYPDDFNLAYTPEAFLLGVNLGAVGEAYALTPAHAKRLVAHMAHVIANFESKFGKITGDEWKPGIPSPFQIDPDSSGSQGENKKK